MKNTLHKPLLSGYAGSSMYPTLRQMDLLEILSYGNSLIRKGDVIFFIPPNEADPVVHRVARITSDGIRTRGDNSQKLDLWTLQPLDIKGRVVAAWRGNTKRRIHGGYLGRFMLFLNRYCRAILRKIFRFRLFLRVLPPQIKPRLLAFNANGRTYFKLVIHRWMIGHYDEVRERWIIRAPFRFLIDEGMSAQIHMSQRSSA